MTKKKIVFIAILLFIIISGLILMSKKNKNQGEVCFKGSCLNVELALTSQARERGLMFRENLDLDKGLLFVYEKEGEYSFWMKNVLFPLDIVWINENKEIVFISENTPPCSEDSCPSIKPGKEAKYVLEINEGGSEKMGFVVGDKLEISLSEL